MNTAGKWILGLGLALALAAVSWWWSHRGAAEPPGFRGDRNRPVPALTAQVRAGEVPVALTALGTVTARQQALVRARVDGLLQSVSFTEGAMVKAGTTIARIDSRPFEAALAMAQGQLDKDQAQLEIARTDLKRYRRLLSEDSIASQQVDSQEALVKQLEGTVAADRGNLAAAQLNLSFCTITAPISGIAGLRQVDPGNMVRASDTTGLVVITEVRPIDVVFAIPQESLGTVAARFQDPVARKEIKVEILARDNTTELGRGTLLAIDNQTDPATGSTKLKAELANEAGTLFPGQFVNVRLIVETLKGALIVPQSAIQRGTPGTFVYVVTNEGTAAVRKVELGPSAGEQVVIRQGLAEGETLVIDGADKLRQGAAVTTVERPQQPGQGDPGGRAAGSPPPAREGAPGR